VGRLLDERVFVAMGVGKFAAPTGKRGTPMDFKKFYFAPEGRVNRKQWWLWLVLPLTAISILLLFVDMATGNYRPEYGIGLFSGIVALLRSPRSSSISSASTTVTNPAGGPPVLEQP
jgi:hypothetical protein